MGSCSSSNSSVERRDGINVTVLRPPTHAPGATASHVVSTEKQPEHEKKDKKSTDEKAKKKERKKGDDADGEKKDKKKDKDGKKKEKRDRKNYTEEKKKGDNTEEIKKEKKKKKKRKDENGGSKEENSSSDSSSSAEDEDDPKQVKDGVGGAVAAKVDAPLSDGGGVDTTATLSGDAVHVEKHTAATDVDGVGIAEVSPVAPPTVRQMVAQADTSIEARIDLSDQGQTTRNNASVTIKMTDGEGGDGGGGAMSVDIVLSTGVEGEVAVSGGSAGGAQV